MYIRDLFSVHWDGYDVNKEELFCTFLKVILG